MSALLQARQHTICIKAQNTQRTCTVARLCTLNPQQTMMDALLAGQHPAPTCIFCSAV